VGEQVDRPRFWLGVGAGLLCALIWGGQAVVMRLSVFEGLTPADVTVLRYLMAGTLVLPSALRCRPFPVGRLGWRRGFVLAMLAGAPYSLVVVGGVAFAPALHSSVVTHAVIPVAATALAYCVLGEQPGLGQVISLGLILVGLALFGWESLSGAPARGYLLFVVAATMWAGFTTLSKLWRVDPMSTTATLVVLSLLSVPLWLTLFPVRLAHASIGTLVLQAGYMGGLVTFLSTYLYTQAIALVGAVRAAVIVTLVPVVTSLMSPVVLAEWPTMREVVGMAVVILGVVLSLRLKPDAASHVS